MGKNRHKNRHDQEAAQSHCASLYHHGIKWPANYTVRIEPSADDTQRYANEAEHRGSQRRIGKWLNWITTFGVVVALLGLGFIYKTLKASEWTARTAYKQLDLAERPWVKMDISIAGPLVVSQDGLSISIRTVTQSTGNSPALSVAAQSKIFVGYAWPDLVTQQKKDALCDDLKKSATVNEGSLPALFPGTNSIPDTWHLLSPEGEVEAASSKTPQGRVIPLIVTCVVYRATFDAAFRSTAYISVISSVENGMGMAVPAKEPVVINPDHLIMDSRTYAE